jgi:hypothetical protein
MGKVRLGLELGWRALRAKRAEREKEEAGDVVLVLSILWGVTESFDWSLQPVTTVFKDLGSHSLSPLGRVTCGYLDAIVASFPGSRSKETGADSAQALPGLPGYQIELPVRLLTSTTSWKGAGNNEYTT